MYLQYYLPPCYVHYSYGWAIPAMCTGLPL